MRIVELKDGTPIRKDFVVRRFNELSHYLTIYPATFLAIAMSLVAGAREREDGVIELIVRHHKVEHLQEKNEMVGYNELEKLNVIKEFKSLPLCLNNDPNDQYHYYFVELDKTYADIMRNSLKVEETERNFSVSLSDPTKNELLSLNIPTTLQR